MLAQVLGLMGRNIKNVYPKNRDIPMRSLEGSIKSYFYVLSVLVGVKLIIEAVSGMGNGRK